MADVVLGGVVGEAEIADDGRRGRLVAVVEVDRRLRGRRRRHRLAAEALARLLEQRPDLVLERLDRGARRLALRHLLLHRQLVPGELLGERVGPRHDAPVVDRAGRARRDAVHAVIADRGIDDVVVVVMRDRVDRAGLLAGVAADADLRVDQVLLFEGSVHRGCIRQSRVGESDEVGVWNKRRARHGPCLSAFAAALLAGLPSSRRDLHVLEVAGLVVDADLRRRDPAGELAGLRSTGSIRPR